jgi:hypothetical protein
MKKLKTFETYNQDKLDKLQKDYAIGDIVYTNYNIPGSKDYIPTPVKIISIKGSGKQSVYICSHNVETSQFKNAPDMMVKKNNIIGPYKTINTPVGPSWVSSNPNTQINQVSNDMYL